MNISDWLKVKKHKTQEVQNPNPYGTSKHAGANNHNQGESRSRRKAAKRSRRQNRK